MSSFSAALINNILVLLILSVPASAAPVFIEGVSEDGGWYDVNKKTKWSQWPQVNPLTPGSRPWQWINLPSDYSMCWAAAGSNILQWWQDRYGNVPTGIPNGSAATTSINGLQNISQLQIYQTICENWSDDGGRSIQAWNWWFNGGILPEVFVQGKTTPSNTTSSGGYWAHLNRTCTIAPNNSLDSSLLFDSYVFYEDLGQEDSFKSVLKSFIDKGYGSTLSLKGKTEYGETGHAITLWGYEERENGELVLYLTDSDDEQYGIFKQAVKMNDTGWLCLSSVDGEEERYSVYNAETGGFFIYEINGLTVPIPEPSAFGLISGALAIGVIRRSRKKID